MSTTIEPIVRVPAHPKEIEREKRTLTPISDDFSASPFEPLTQDESGEDWGKELRIALAFAEDFDLYRAITGFKRALVLLPADKLARRLEMEYDVILAYYLGKKYRDVVHSFEKGGLVCADPHFPAYSDLLLLLYDSYKQLGETERAAHLLCRIEQSAASTAEKLSFLSSIERGDLACLGESCVPPNRPYIQGICENYQKEAKSVRRAEMLNAFLPGAGYWYVGQRETAVTSFLMNSLFIAAAVHFFERGNVAAGIVTLSFESGWYFGGIYGGGLAVKAYNERLYESYADKIAKREKLFPLFMLKYTF